MDNPDKRQNINSDGNNRDSKGLGGLKSRLVYALILAFVLGVTVIMWANMTFGWFASSDHVTGSGMSVQVDAPELLEIFVKNENDDFVDFVNVATPTLTADQPSQKIENRFDNQGNENLFPGASGSFTFYVHDSTNTAKKTDGIGTYSFKFNVSVVNNYLGSDNDWWLNSSEDNANKNLSLDYINSHIMFFLKKSENGIYSEWINPEEGKYINVSNEEPKEITVYWVWVSDYNQILKTANELKKLRLSPIVDDDARGVIKNYYKGKSEKIFMNGNDIDAYNRADTFIGMNLENVFVKLEVVPVAQAENNQQSQNEGGANNGDE